MTEKHRAITLEKEFELERVSLFSDAVFAIAITLLIIDTKWPELPEKMEGVDVLKLMLPTLGSFTGFVLSFYFIGLSWSQHLRLFKLVRKYDQGLITRNLISLFFVVTFPFTAAGMFGHLRVGFILPMYFYLGNLVLVAAAHFILCRYIIRVKPFLTIDGEQQEKKYIYVRSRNATLAMAGMIFVAAITGLIFPHRLDFVGYSCISGPLLLRFANRNAGKFEPVGHS